MARWTLALALACFACGGSSPKPRDPSPSPPPSPSQGPPPAPPQNLAAWADAARASGPLIVEYGTEVNGDWNPWSAPYNSGLDVGPGKFQKAYRHIVGVMRARGANITWALHYNAQPFPDDPRNTPAA